jgi:hypothetical protein
LLTHAVGFKDVRFVEPDQVSPGHGVTALAGDEKDPREATRMMIGRRSVRGLGCMEAEF